MSLPPAYARALAKFPANTRYRGGLILGQVIGTGLITSLSIAATQHLDVKIDGGATVVATVGAGPNITTLAGLKTFLEAAVTGLTVQNQGGFVALATKNPAGSIQLVNTTSAGFLSAVTGLGLADFTAHASIRRVLAMMQAGRPVGIVP